MRLVQFLTCQGVRVGVERAGRVLDLECLGVNVKSVKALLEQGPSKLDSLRGLVDRCPTEGQPTGELQMMAPIHNPGKILCVGLNYRDHCLEQNKEFPAEPVMFSKFATAITGPKSDISLPRVSQQVDWEVEMAFVIGKEGKHIPVESAMDHVVGYTVANDVTARDWQKKAGGQFLLGKTPDGFCPLGPALVTKDEIPDPHQLNVKLSVNGVVKQESNTCQLIFNIPFLISYASSIMTLSPGDIVLTGTPGGVGVFRDPKEFIKCGDVVEAQIDNLGTISNTFIQD